MAEAPPINAGPRAEALRAFGALDARRARIESRTNDGIGGQPDALSEDGKRALAIQMLPLSNEAINQQAAGIAGRQGVGGIDQGDLDNSDPRLVQAYEQYQDSNPSPEPAILNVGTSEPGGARFFGRLGGLKDAIFGKLKRKKSAGFAAAGGAAAAPPPPPTGPPVAPPSPDESRDDEWPDEIKRKKEDLKDMEKSFRVRAEGSGNKIHLTTFLSQKETDVPDIARGRVADNLYQARIEPTRFLKALENLSQEDQEDITRKFYKVVQEESQKGNLDSQIDKGWFLRWDKVFKEFPQIFGIEKKFKLGRIPFNELVEKIKGVSGVIPEAVSRAGSIKEALEKGIGVLANKESVRKTGGYFKKRLPEIVLSAGLGGGVRLLLFATGFEALVGVASVGVGSVTTGIKEINRFYESSSDAERKQNLLKKTLKLNKSQVGKLAVTIGVGGLTGYAGNTLAGWLIHTFGVDQVIKEIGGNAFSQIKDVFGGLTSGSGDTPAIDTALTDQTHPIGPSEPTLIGSAVEAPPPVQIGPQIEEVIAQDHSEGVASVVTEEPVGWSTETQTQGQTEEIGKQLPEESPPKERSTEQAVQNLPNIIIDHPGDTFWESFNVPDGWINENGVTRGDVVKDMVVKFAQYNGHNLNVVHVGDSFNLNELLTSDQLEIVKKTMETEDALDYWKNVRPIAIKYFR